MDVLAHCKIYPISNYINVPGHAEPISQCGVVHLMIDEIKNKSYQWPHQQGTVESNTNKFTLVIDLLNVWIPNRYVVKDVRLVNLQALIKFLNDEVYSGSWFNENSTAILEGLIIDNLSIYQYESVKLFNIFLNLLRKIRHKYGCWIKTVSFQRLPLPPTYLTGMDKVVTI